jgi:Glycosyltransferase
MDENEAIQSLKEKISELESQLKELSLKYRLQEAKAADLQNDFHMLQSELFDYYQYAHELKGLCSGLKKELDEVYGSSRWKVTGPLWSLKNKLKFTGRGIPQSADSQSTTSQEIPLLTMDKEKKSILFLDRSIPRPDHDAGSLSVFQYCGLLIEMGFDVYFLTDDFGDLHAPDTAAYIDKLNSAGIHVLFGEFYFKNYQEWLTQNAHKFDMIILNRPNIATKYIDLVRMHSDALIVYFGCDLHFLRELRDYECTGDAGALERSGQLKTKEYWIMRQADLVVLYSSKETALVKSEFGIANVVTAPLNYYEDARPIHTDFKDTSDILFVGGFSHKPNLDAALWFYSEVWPSLKSALPNARWIIAGSNPPADILKLADERLIVTGFISDEKLTGLYKSCRVCVIPLRFGAGIKGKTLEAMKNGIPVVSTSIGIEGIDGVEAFIPPADTAQDFTRQVITLYNNVEIAKLQSQNLQDYLKHRYSKKSLLEVLQKITSR